MKKLYSAKFYLLTFMLIAIMGMFSTKSFASCTVHYTWAQTASLEITFTDSTIGATPSSTYSWDFGDGTQDTGLTSTHIYNAPGRYGIWLYVSDTAALGCNGSFIDSIDVTGTPACNVTVTFASVAPSCGSCADGSISAQGAGGSPPYNYSWSVPVVGAFATGLLPGTYSVCTSDINGCSACAVATLDTAACQAAYTWYQNTPNVIHFTDSSKTSGIASFYNWDFGDGQTDQSKNPIHTYSAPGTYNVCLTLQDSNTVICTSSFCDVITVTGTLICNVSVGINLVNHPYCPTYPSGSIQAVAIGGTPGYTYSWSNGETTNPLQGLLMGTYSVCATDINGCSACSGSYILDTSHCVVGFGWHETSPLAITFNDSTMGSSASRTYSWDFGDGSTSTDQNPTYTYSGPGRYGIWHYVNDTAALGCNGSFIDSIDVTGACYLNVSINAPSLPTCSSCADGSLEASASSGTAPYTYSWSTGATVQNISGLLPGTYSICITDSGGCTACSIVYPLDTASCNAGYTWFQSGPNVVNFSDTSQTTGSYYFRGWDFGDGQQDYSKTPVHTYSAPGTYNVCINVQDSSVGCNATYCSVVTVTGTIICNLSVNTSVVAYTTCSSCTDGEAFVYAAGGTAPYQYSWSFGPTTDYISGLANGTYSVMATDANGCTGSSNILIRDTVFACDANFHLYPDTNILHNYYVVNLSNGLSPMTYSWTWGDGGTDTGAYPSHSYAASGFYEICLTITAANSCTDSYCDSSFVTKHHDSTVGFRFQNPNTNSMTTVSVIAPSTTGIKAIADLKSLSVFPNPVTSVLTVSLPANKNKNITYKVFSITGSEVMLGIFSEKENKLDLRNLKQGIYFLEVRDANGSNAFRKIVKE